MYPLMTCLHAAESNVEILERTLVEMPFEVQHVVDTHLLKMIRQQRPINEQKDYAFAKMMALIEQQPTFIFVTCTNYIVLLDQIELNTSIPVLKIDELLFDQLKSIQSPIKMLFTNEQTIEGTMARLRQTISSKLRIDVIYIPEAFNRYLAGDKFEHDQKVLHILHELDSYQNTVVVAQLSMVNAAEKYSKISGNLILNPITAIKEYISSYMINKVN